MAVQLDRDKAKRSIRQILNTMATEADPHLLNEYRALFKKEVSLFRRSWAAACLLMIYDRGTAGTGKSGRDRSRRGGEKGRGPERPGRVSEPGPRSRAGEGSPAEKAPYRLADEDSRRLFLSAGRSRRVFPREILGLITARTGVPREDVGAIRILDNYSFVQVRDTAADAIIEALNGQPFRGRPLTVSYARARKDGSEEPGGYEEEPADTGEDDAGNRGSMDTDEPVDTGDRGSMDADEAVDTGEDDTGDGGDYGAEDTYPDETEALSEQDENHPGEEEI